MAIRVCTCDDTICHDAQLEIAQLTDKGERYFQESCEFRESRANKTKTNVTQRKVIYRYNPRGYRAQ